MTPRRYRIVVALDLSEYAEIVLEHALDQAARRGSADLHFLTVVPTLEAAAPAKIELAKLVLQGLESQRGTDWESRLHVRIGDPTREIADLAGELDADLLVVGRFGVHDAKRRESIAGALVDRVGCPTLVIGMARELEANAQCPRCVAVREESDGERWFCDEHSAPDRLDLTTRLPMSSLPIGGGPLW